MTQTDISRPIRYSIEIREYPFCPLGSASQLNQIDSLVPPQSTVDCVGVARCCVVTTRYVSTRVIYIDHVRVVVKSSYDV